ncbi:MAG: C-GCAxxG-C-C family protein [Pleomorphochaeta sp.]
MGVNELKSKAKALHEKDYNCAQSVLCAFSDILDSDEKTLFKISEGFGSGMGEKQECCGAVTGGIMVLSLLNSNGDSSNLSKSETYELAAKLRNKFIDKYDITTCEVLKNIFVEDDYNICNDYIIETVEFVNQIIEEENLLN